MDRRTFLRRSAAVGAVIALDPTADALAAERPAGFAHGVASGDPLDDRVMLWTRVTPEEGAGGTLKVHWVVAEDERLRRVVSRGALDTGAERDWTVKVDAAGLRPGREYFFGFRCAGVDSPVGRTRTAPAGPLARMRLASVSCSSYPAGHYNAYARLAEQDVDLVVHVGDYIYESGSAGSFGRPPQPRREIVSLDDYRTRYAQYRSDPDLQAAHAAAPWACVWDDHESANNSWHDGAGSHQPATEGPWSRRRADAVQAYGEWMPIRFPDPGDPLRIWRRMAFGDLVDLLMIDTRLYGRNAPATPTGATDTGSDDPDRRMLGEVQEAWLREQVRGSRARWRVFGNQTMISPHQYGGGLPYLPEEITETGRIRQGGANEGADNWGAYRVERDRVIALLRERGDNVFLTGDIHTAWGCDIVEDPNSPAAYDRVTGRGSAGVELVCTSVTSNNFGETLPREAVTALSTSIMAGNQNVSYCDLGGHGFTLVDVAPDEVRADWMQVPTIAQRAGGLARTASRRVAAGRNHLEGVV